MKRSQESYLLESPGGDLLETAEDVFGRVLRTDWIQPGFVIVVLPRDTESHELRQTMVSLKQELSRLFELRWGEPLQYLSLGRFDQQASTKLHLDGGPERSLLMLGYEPTEVASELLIADYTACARRLGISPAAFMVDHNPMFQAAESVLEDDILRINDWAEDRCRIVVINNSCVPENHPRFTAGVLHGAHILKPDPTKRRVINSTMLVPGAQDEERTAGSVHEFLTTDAISGAITL